MIPFLMLLGYLVILLYVGRLGHVGHSQHTAADYFVASRTLGPFLLIMSIFGTTMTAFALVGSTGEAWEEGIGVYGQMASWSGIIHSACFFLIGVKLWHYGKQFGYNTQIQFFRDRFQSAALGTLLFPIVVALVIPYIVINIVGSGSTIQSITQGAFPSVFPDTKGGIPAWIGAGAVCGVVLVYVFGGGMRSTAFANVVQTTVLLVLSIFAVVVVMGKLGGPVAASERVAELRPDLLVRGPAGGHEGHMKHLHFLTYMFIPLSVAMFPHLFQHWMTAKSSKAFRATVMLHPIFIMLVWAPCILLGIWASTAVYNGQPVIPPDWTGEESAKVLGTMMKKLTNPFLAGLIGVGIVSATMALDSQFLCLSSMFTHDIVVHHFGEERFSDSQRVWLGRTFVVLIVVASYLLSMLADRSVFELGVWCFSGFSSLFPLVFAALYWRRVTAMGAMASVLVAAVTWFLLFAGSGWAGHDYLIWGMMPVTINIAAAAVALVVVSLMTRPPAPEVIERFFPGRSAQVKRPAATREAKELVRK